MTKPYSYLTISKPQEGFFEDRGSKFYALASPVMDEEQIRQIITNRQKKYHKARHHCYAWRLGTDGNNYRANDDGEPAGTAGKPILSLIDGQHLTNIVVVVSRIFGGTLLGKGGLIRAYGNATHDALNRAMIIKKEILTYYLLQFDYEQQHQVMAYISNKDITITQQAYSGQGCKLTCAVPQNKVKDFLTHFELCQIAARYLY